MSWGVCGISSAKRGHASPFRNKSQPALGVRRRDGSHRGKGKVFTDFGGGGEWGSGDWLVCGLLGLLMVVAVMRSKCISPGLYDNTWRFGRETKWCVFFGGVEMDLG